MTDKKEFSFRGIESEIVRRHPRRDESDSRLTFWVRVINRSFDFYIMVKIRVRGAYYTQWRIVFEVLR